MKNLFYKLLLMDNSLILNFGDSQGEVYDYVFYNNINYKKYINNYSPGWRSGWALRGLNNHNMRIFYLILSMIFLIILKMYLFF